jgi:hypothetical protein
MPKKISMLTAGYSSNVLCLCLTLKEAKNLCQRLTQVPLSDSHSPHRFLVDVVQKQDDNSQLVHKFLQKKYQDTWRQVRKLETTDALVAFWVEQQGKIPLDALYWVIAHHPNMEDNIIENITLDLWLILARTRRQWPLLQIQYEEEVKQRQAWQARLQKITEEKQFIAIQKANQEELLSLQAALENSKQEKNHYQQQCYKMQKELEFLKNKLAALQEKAELKKADLPEPVATTQVLVQPENSCPVEKNFTLSGKSVLFIGGLRSQMPHFREWIEAAKGQFLHHDGGLEDHYTHLQTLVTQADWVFCPLDCVSHNALQTAKKLCQRQDKPCIFLKKSSFFMFSHSVKAVAQHTHTANLFSIRETGKSAPVI